MEHPPPLPSAAPTARCRRGRGRRPITEVRAEVLRAAGQLLLQQGGAGFTFSGVSALSGVSKTTLYRHWPSKGALALDGYFALVGREIEVRDSGNVRADLVDVLSRFITVLQRSAVRTAFTQLIGQAQSDADLADSFSEHYFGPRRAAVTGLLEAAQTRGEIRADADIPTVIDALWGAVYVRLLLPNLREDLTVAFATRVVDTVLEGVGAEGLE